MSGPDAYHLTREQIDELISLAHGGTMLGHDVAIKALLGIEEKLSGITHPPIIPVHDLDQWIVEYPAHTRNYYGMFDSYEEVVSFAEKHHWKKQNYLSYTVKVL